MIQIKTHIGKNPRLFAFLHFKKNVQRTVKFKKCGTYFTVQAVQG